MGIWQRYSHSAIENGSSACTVTLGALGVYTRPGDGASWDGGRRWYEINDVDSINRNTQFTIVGTFEEDTIADGPLIIDNRSYRHQIESDILETVRAAFAAQTQVIETSGPPSATIGADKSIAFDPDARAYYHKTNGVWGDAIQLGGADGIDAGFQFAFDDTVSMVDPGSGKFRFNNATFAAVTAIAIDDASNDIGNPDVSAYVTTWGASTSAVKGTLIVRKVGSSAFRVFAVTGLTDNTGWTQLAVTPIASSGTINANDQCAVAFIRAGDKGNAGADGANAGFLMTLDRATVTMVDPGAGKIKFNNASFNSTTALAISDLSSDSGGPDVSAAILAWTASTNAVKGQVRLAKIGAARNFALFDVTGLVDNDGWTQLALAFRTAAGTLMTNDVCAITFAQAGNKGIDGTNGTDGLSPGFSFSFDATTTMADPGSGKIRFDNATLASIANIAISDQSAASGNPDVSASVLSWDDSTNASMRGTIRITKKGHEEVYADFSITGAATDNAGWSNFAVSLLSSAGALSNGDPVIVSATRTGDKGLDGDGAGNVIGPSGTTDGNLVAFDTTTGTLIKDSGVSVSPDGSFSADSDAILPTQKAVATYVASAVSAQIAASDVEVLKGPIDCSGDPNYPSADAGHVYRVSVAGRIGGATGPIVEVNDRLECYADASPSGNHATVGGNWIISQSNIDGAVTGPASSTSGDIATFNGASGKVVQDSGKKLSTDGTFASNSDTNIPTEKAAKTYTDAGLAAQVDRSTISVVKTAAATLAVADVGKTYRMNVASAHNLTVPVNSSVAIPIDSYFNIEQYGAGLTTIVADTGVTIRSRNGLKMGGRYAMATLHKIGTDEWILGGDVTT